MKVHIGQLILHRLTEIQMSKTDFAKNINTSRENVYNIFAKDNIDVEQLLVISKVLRYNFYQHYVDELVKEKIVSEPQAEYKITIPPPRRMMVDMDEVEYDKIKKAGLLR